MARTPKVVEDRREQIIDAAMNVFAHKGYSRATNKDIALEAGITPGLIYHYFESKEALLQAIINERSPLRVVRATSPTELEQPPEVFLRSLLLNVLHIIEGEQFIKIVRTVLPEILYNPAMQPVGSGIIDEEITFLSSYFERQMSIGKIRKADPRLAAQTLMGCVIGSVLRRHIFHDPQALQYTREQLVDSILDVTLQGLLPR
ncbi:TetR family transcriptional regulator [Thermosporothrix hazakensis]|jgi:AcrR family transcriptional regulator|uniref:TetR family transcriptional regulator n=2 Tax=Thermosporothrix TaxID=768650 RepID=A0A326U528_THEHA|nr:TetR/AcrR family transcriptional regulator [Thermosporothrix hazakensis]PZW26408.1 TetR family transcriptional regulator [Thermosporothrix hazakensis]BBH90589.1 TetR family transcriptional regulator [Thermosporothrix sp. COM3]GCE48641.1 TetR family transcriptional regulator [Thermosporothrix hazakensis]